MLATLAVLATVLLRPGAESPRGANAANRTDSVTATPPAAPPAPPPTPVPAAVAAGDSAKEAVAKAARDSIARDSARALTQAAKDSIVKRDSVDKAAAAAAARANVANTKSGTVKAPAKPTPKTLALPESVAKQCAALIERFGIGEKLSDAEAAFLKQRCNRK